MSEEWLEYLKENNPELYAQAVASVDHAVRWRDRHIKRLESERDQLQTQLEAVRGLNRFDVVDGDPMMGGGYGKCRPRLDKKGPWVRYVDVEKALSTTKPAEGQPG